MEESMTIFEKRQLKIEDAISKLTEISGDLNKMIAVHEQRLSQQEKVVTTMEEILEKRREDADNKLRTVYETMRTEDKLILTEINKMREESSDQYGKLSKKITDMEKMLWTYMGGFSVVAFLIAYGGNLLKVILKV
jgi:predicted  nucleic acid-binding Zn-ribbon protein